MSFIETLKGIWHGNDAPFFIAGQKSLHLRDLQDQPEIDLSCVQEGDVVALIGDFDAPSIASLIKLIDLKSTLVPLTAATAPEHSYFFATAGVDVVVEGGVARRLDTHHEVHPLIAELRKKKTPGLVLFSTGTTGRPKAILHDMFRFLSRFTVKRPALRTLNFLLFDHIGGINTLLHTLFNRGLIVAPSERNVASILDTIGRYDVELLPTTPTFLRMMLMSGAIPGSVPPCLKVITYGTERMDQPTLSELCQLLPEIDFRQTYGMSELGIVRVKSESRQSLYMKIGGDGVETRIVEDALQIRSPNRMQGYLNADSPFDEEGWYDTHDLVEAKGDLIRVIGRKNETINVGGLKFMPSEVERVALQFTGVVHAKAAGRVNPITGQHVELLVELIPTAVFDKATLKQFMQARLPSHMVPQKITSGSIKIGHRFKRDAGLTTA